MKNSRRYFAILMFCLLLPAGSVFSTESANISAVPPNAKAAVIACKGDIDYGLYKSIKRRTKIALDNGAEYLIYEVGTYGGLLKSADDISKFFILEIPSLSKKAKTVAYVTTEAISAGALISVSCQDIIMRENTIIGDCAPIALGTNLEGVEREKIESPTRAFFSKAAHANGYPEALLKAMVSINIEVYRIKNLKTGKYEFFEANNLPEDANIYQLEKKELIDSSNEILTLTANKALEYGIARAIVKDINEALDFLAKRDDVNFSGPPMILQTTWSEELARWLNSTTVMAVLVALALLGVYMELSTPGVGLPGLVAVICFVLIIGSKYVSGLANWIEVVILLTGILLLLLEFFVIPGFGIAGFAGIACVLVGLFGMLVKNPPEQMPWPEGSGGWSDFTVGIIAISAGFAGFIIFTLLLSRYLPKIPVANRMVLAAPQESVERKQQGSGGAVFETQSSTLVSQNSVVLPVQVGQQGLSISQLRPAGKAVFNGKRLDVVSRGEVIEADRQIIVELIEGNRIVVKETSV